MTLGDEITADQRMRVQQLLTEYSDVLIPIPGRTNLIEHEIKLLDHTPVYQNSATPPSIRPTSDDLLNRSARRLSARVCVFTLR